MISQQRCDTETIWKKDIDDVLSKYPQDSDVCVYQDESIYADGLDLSIAEPLHGKSSHLVDVPHMKALAIGDPDSIRQVRKIRISHKCDPMTSVRSFIGGLSHCYNNLLMGIWGHASLIGMILDKSDPFQSWLTKLEDLIQNGSNLIQLLFGYIAERRSAARELRLKQLTNELESYDEACRGENDLSIVEVCVCELAHATTKVQITASLTRVIEQMQALMREKRAIVGEQSLVSNEKACSHLAKIDTLMKRGDQLIRNLQYYAGVRIPVRKKVDLKSIVQRQAVETARRNPEIELSIAESVSLPKIDADPHQIKHALAQLVDNAVRSAAEKGTVRIELNTMSSESPGDRCGVHMLKNYMVITVRDSGGGMTTASQSKIFEPFFTSQKGQGRPGLGLSAATGIVRAHGGYIQVRSKAGVGSTFKIYLPAG